MNIARINAATGEVINIELWDQVPVETAEHQFRDATAGGGIGWVWNGDAFIAPPAPPAPVPTAVDMRQASLKLDSEVHGEGTRLEAVEAYVASQSRTVRIEWDRAKELRRDHPMVNIMGFFFGLSADDLDQWFREAADIGPTLAL